MQEIPWSSGTRMATLCSQVHVAYPCHESHYTVHIFQLYLFHFRFNRLKPTGYVMHQQFNIQQLYVFMCFVFI